ncbi:MAG: ABC transporter substrate-binding protein [Proteobacteria bacterium]|nr:ABC transporter substrate-binding protein [Pseudomonadota bacterium]
MTSKHRGGLAIVSVASVLAVVLATAPASAQKKGGNVIVAHQSAPPLTDAQASTAEASRNVSLHWIETLYARDEKTAAIPDLAQKVDISEDGLTYAFTLREGVKFHNGQEMTAEDVKASLERYAKVGGSAPIMKPVDSITATSKYVVTVKLKNVVPGFVELLSSPRAPAGIMPASEGGKERGQINHIGTGPYQFVEYKPDSHVSLKRFDGYSANTNYTKRDGFGGKKTAYFDTVTIRHIPEAGARTAALETGEVHCVDSVLPPQYKRITESGNKNIKFYPSIPWAYQTIIMNASQGVTANIKVRQAIQAILDDEEILAIAGDGLYQLTHGWQHPGSTYFAGDVGKEFYNVKDVAKAKALLAEAGYKGEEIVVLTDSTIKNHNDTGVVAAEQLRKAGLNIKLNVVDWPTAFQIRLKPEGWNMWTLGFGIEPYEGPYNVASFFTTENDGKGAQWVSDPELQRANQVLNSALKLEDRKKAFADFQKRFFEFVPAIKVGDLGRYFACRANVAGFAPYRIPRMWDTWFE